MMVISRLIVFLIGEFSSYLLCIVCNTHLTRLDLHSLLPGPSEPNFDSHLDSHLVTFCTRLVENRLID